MLTPTTPTLNPTLYNPKIWKLVFPEGAPGSPPPRDQASAVWDPKGRLLVYGGLGNSGVILNDLWQLDWMGSSWAWTEITGGTAPPARQAHTAVWDTTKNRMLVFGGFGNNGVQNDVWQFDGADHWRVLSPAGTIPPARAAHSAVWNPSGSAMIVFGGHDEFDLASGTLTIFDDVWRFQADRWTKLTTNRGPTARNRHSAVWNMKTPSMLMYGGFALVSPFVLDDLWQLQFGSGNSAQWTPIGTTGENRYGQSAVWESDEKRMSVLWGQDGSLIYSGDHWQSNGNSWASVATAPGSTTPPAGALRATAYCPKPARIFAFGGSTAGGRTNEFWLYEKRFPFIR